MIPPAFGLGVVLFVTGCGSSQMTNNTEITGEVAECLPVGTPTAVFVARAIWYPHSSGVGSTDASPLGHASGVLALAGNKLWFMAWNNEEHHFDMMQSLAVLTAAQIRISSFGPSTLLVVQSRDLSFDSFELMKKGHFGSDPESTQTLYDTIQGLRAKNPRSDD